MQNKIIVPEDKIYKNFLKYWETVEYNIIEKTIKNWDELKEVIENYEKQEEKNIETNNINISLKINLTLEYNNDKYYLANSSINLKTDIRVNFISKDGEIIIKRDKSLIDFPLPYFSE